MKTVKSRWIPYLTITAVLAALLLFATGLIATAQEPDVASLDPDEVTGDDGKYEMGIEWISDFYNCAGHHKSDLENMGIQCSGFYDLLAEWGWGGYDSFNWSNDQAWAEDFKRSAAGGTEESIVDDVDFTLFCDHGTADTDSYHNKWLSALYFGEPHDGDCTASPGDAYHAYGTNDMEWLAFDACAVLDDNSRYYWATTMYDLHEILGFKTVKNTSNIFGEWFASYMLGWYDEYGNELRPPYKIAQSWYEVSDDTQPAGTCARVVAEKCYFLNDYLPGRGYYYPDTHGPGYCYQDHCVAAGDKRKLDVETQNRLATLPVLTVVPRAVTQGYVLDIAAAFGMGNTDVYSDSTHYYMIDRTGTATYTLQVDRTTGGYKYRDADKLWASPVQTPTLPSLAWAEYYGDFFFTGDGRFLPAATYRNGQKEIGYEEQVEMGETLVEGEVEEVELGRVAVDVSLTWGREVSVTAGTAEGAMLVNVPVIGPGARSKMYMGEGGEFLGVQGGSRDVEASGDNSTIMTADAAWTRFLSDPSSALFPPPTVFDTAIRHGEILAYYEMPYLDQQAELIPTWLFSATLMLDGHPVAHGNIIYLPASTDYRPPVVSILSPLDGDTFSPGEVVTLNGEVTEFGQPPFSYEWFSSQQGVLGTGQTLDVSLWPVHAKGELARHNVTLRVTDANGLVGSDMVEVLVRTAVYLPLVVRGQ